MLFNPLYWCRTIIPLHEVARSNDPEIKDRLHPLMSGLAEGLKNLKGLNGSVWWKKFSIPVPFVVEQRVVFVESAIGSLTGTAILHIRVRKVRDGYANKVRADEEDIKKGQF